MIETNPVRRIAALVSGRPLTRETYQLDNLLLGIAAEQARLGARHYLVFKYCQSYDYDGLTECVTLVESYNSLSVATKVTDWIASRAMDVKTSKPDARRKSWKLESEGTIHFVPRTPEDNPLRLMHRKVFKLRSGQFDTEYHLFGVVGGFRGHVVGDELVGFLQKDHELSSYFRTCGERIRDAKPHLVTEIAGTFPGDVVTPDQNDQEAVALVNELNEALDDLAAGYQKGLFGQCEQHTNGNKGECLASLSAANNIVRAVADAAGARIARRAMQCLQARKDCLQSGDDSGLENLWDEICVQVQGERSALWDAYERTIYPIAGQYVAGLPYHEKCAIRLQLESSGRWPCRGADDAADSLATDNEIVEFLVHEYLYPLADSYSNARIRAFLDPA